MNARMLVFVASKLFAVYLVLTIGVPMASNLIGVVLRPTGVTDDGKSRLLLFSAIGIGIVVIVAAVFWFCAFLMSRGVALAAAVDPAPADEMSYDRWQAVVVMLVGGISALHALAAIKLLLYEIVSDSNRDPFGPVSQPSFRPEVLIGGIIFGLLAAVLLLAPSRIVAGLNMLRGLALQRPAKGDVS